MSGMLVTFNTLYIKYRVYIEYRGHTSSHWMKNLAVDAHYKAVVE